MAGSDRGSLRPNDAAPSLAGRTEELDQLRQWLAETLSGSPRVVVVTGDAGTGKSRLVVELIAEARAAGMRPFVGRCIEDSRSPLLPLAALIDALRPDLEAYGAALTAGSAESGTASALVAHTARALMATSADRPVLLVLEDAQWAEQATIELVAHVAGTLAHEGVFREAPVMLVVTGRAGRAPAPVRRLLSRLTRETIGRELRVDGLDDLGIFAMLAAQTGSRPSSRLVTLVREATSGNPLEIKTLVARLDQAGALELRGRELISTIDAAALPADEGTEDERAPLGSLSASAASVVTVLAMLRGARFAVLEAASGVDAEVFEAAIDEATDAGVITDDGTRVEFVEPAAARALIRAMSPRRRRQLHATIARRLDESGGAAAAPAVVIDQLERAGAEADATLLPLYAGAAADAAFEAGAWSDAVRHYDVAMKTASLDARERAVLEYRAAIAAYRNADKAAAAAGASRAVELARSAGDLPTWGDAALLHARVTLDTKLVAAFLDAVGDREPGHRARMHALLSELSFDRLRLEEAAAHAAAAQSAVAMVDDPAVAARVEFALGLHCFGTFALSGAATHLAHCEEHARHAGDALVEAWARGREALLGWTRGELVEAAALAGEVAASDRAGGWWAEYSLVTAIRSGIAVAQGNLGAAERFGAEAASAHRRSEHGAIASLLWSALAGARVLRSDSEGARAALAEWAAEDPRPTELYGLLVDALSGDKEDGDFEKIRRLVRPGMPISLMSVSLAATAVELADALDRPDIATNAFEVLNAAYAMGVRFTPGWCAYVPRLAGVACLLAGSHETALEWLRVAETGADHVGAAGELARARYDIARSQLAAGVDAGGALLEAADAFGRLGFPSLARSARRLAGKSDEGPSSDAPTARVILVTDIIDSTPLTARVGDQRFVELLREHNRIVRTRLQQFDGVEFKHTGDGIAAWFLTAGAAVECGLLILEDLGRSNVAHEDEPLFVRVGIAAGEVVYDGADVFGLAVITAFRICDHAREGRILVSKEVPPLARSSNFRFEACGDVTLKGFSEKSSLFAVVANTPDLLGQGC